MVNCSKPAHVFDAIKMLTSCIAARETDIGRKNSNVTQHGLSTWDDANVPKVAESVDHGLSMLSTSMLGPCTHAKYHNDANRELSFISNVQRIGPNMIDDYHLKFRVLRFKS
ncbi:hypothetical protein ACH5RR_026046 [Cinchona calisaya]|uniref:Uncharacterized protein n=1 Tax=Cinchona calisaya TaxID=153742 RepID=A0ABD2Z1D4_9GENT